MEKDKISFIKEKEVKNTAKKNAEFYENLYSENPIKAKFLAFLKTKKETKDKDLI